MSLTNSTHTPGILHAGSRSPYILWLTWVIWLPFLIPTTVGWLQTQPTLPRLFATSVCLTLFVGYYLLSSLQEAKRMLMDASSASSPQKTPVWLACAILSALSFIIAFLGSEHGYSWLAPFIYTSAYVGSRLSVKQAVWTVGALMGGMVTLGGLLGLHLYDIGSAVLTCTMVVVVVIAVFGTTKANLALQAAREELERLAVTAERLRIARDLHDLLGHNLSLIALKSELARRLVSAAPERAAIEIGDIEQVARTTLQEVREAVASYRQPALASELEAAQEILAAAGITYKYQGHEQLLIGIPPAAEAILSWAVREGVTNVIKHSRAQHCMVALMRDKQSIRIEIADDGRALSSVNEDAGNGLRGLAERTEAFGGRFEAASRAIGGFRLAITLPIASKQYVPDEHINGATTPTGVLQVMSEIAGSNGHKRED